MVKAKIVAVLAVLLLMSSYVVLGEQGGPKFSMPHLSITPDLRVRRPVLPEGVSLHMSYVGRYGVGPAYSIVTIGDHVYLGDSETLDSFDVSNPRSPKLKDRLPGIGYFLDLELGPEGALIAGNYLGVGIIDLEGPEDLWYYSVWVPPEEIYDNYVTFDVSYDSRGYVYAAVTGGGVGILDVSDLTDPQEVAHIDPPAGMYAFAVANNGEYLAIGYVPQAGSGKIDVYDISNPRAPAYAWTFQDPNLQPYSLAMDDSYLYVGCPDRLMIVSLGSHEKVSEVELQNDVQKIRLFGDVVIASFYYYTQQIEYGGVSYVDVSDPANPQVVGVYSGGSGSFDAWMSGNNIFVADGSGGLLVLDASSPGNIKKIGKYDTPDYLYFVDAVNGYPVVSNPDSGILVFDPYTDREFPRIVGQIMIPPVQDTFSWDISATGDLLLVDTIGGGVRIYNLSNPSSPVSVGSFSIPGDYVMDVYADGDTAYIGTLQNGLFIVDISDPSSPTTVARIDIMGAGYQGEIAGIAESNGIVALGLSHKILVQELPWKGIVIVDARDPENARIVANVTLADMGLVGDIWDVAMEGNLVFFSVQGPSRDQPGWIGIMDVSDPEHPVMRAAIEADYFPFGISAQGNYLYTAQVRVGVEVYDVTDPSNPVPYDLYYPGFAIDVEPWENWIFASHIYSGLYTLAYDQGPPTVDILNPQDGSYVPSGDIVVSWQGEDDTKIIAYYISVDGGDYEYIDMATEWTVSGLDEGAHSVTILARDAASNYGYDSVSFTVDPVPPTVDITSPEDGSVLATNTVTVRWDMSDNYGIDHVEVRLDGGEWQDVGAVSEYTFESLPEGNHTVDVKAVDYAGNEATDTVSFSIVPPYRLEITSPEEGAKLNVSDVTVAWDLVIQNPDEPLDYFEISLDEGSPVIIQDTSARSYTLEDVPDGEHVVTVTAVSVHDVRISDSVSFSIDTQAPTVEITSPSQDEYLSTGSFTVMWTYEEEHLDHFEVSVDGGAWQDVGTATSYQVSDLSEGDHTISVRGVDTYGNVGPADTVTVHVDLSAPEITIVEPTEGSYLATSSPTVRWECRELYLDHIEISIDDGEWQDVGTSTSYTPQLEDGPHKVSVRAVDKVGRTDEDSVSFVVDTTPPEVSIESPSDGVFLATGSVVVQWSGSDNIALDHYEIRIDGGEWQDVGASNTYTVSLADGSHTVEVKAVDKAGNEATDAVVFTVDTTPPEVAILSPSSGEFVGTSAVQVVWECTEEHLDHFEVSVDGGAWQDIGVATSTTLSLTEGPHTVAVKAIDKAGNEATASVAFVVDTTAPTVSITSPEQGSYLAQSQVQVTWTYEEEHLDHFEVSVDGGAWQDVGTATSTTLTLDDGSHSVTVRAIDKAGNEATASVAFVVDTTEPVISISSPTQGQKVGKTVTVYWNVTEENVEKVEISIDGGAWQDVTGMNSYTFSNLPGGDHTVTIKVTDKAGNTATASVSFRVSVVPWLYIIIGIVAIAVVLAAVLLLRKKS